ncbi:hypothetical protein [Pontibaca salina]|uniref:Uncharacterized protein n=1 Tax=Pontibaca salina TaxID=2795731 RepID=A0A934LX71_9RHOB|nr:hypothetical protein [Pontibaca salina]MBI6628272.1 hypothetical protein [Pontibaca salina]
MSLLHIDEAEPATWPVVLGDLSPAAAALEPALIWQKIEAFIRCRWAERSVTWIVNGGAYRSGAGAYWTPSLYPAGALTVEVWNRDSEDWQSVQVKKTPLGGCLLARNDTYRITATVGSTDAPPAAVLEAYRRLAEYIAAEQSAPAGARSYSIDVGQISESIRLDPTHMAKAIYNSGAADLLRPYRRLGVTDETA